jgi:hypothetical protein
VSPYRDSEPGPNAEVPQGSIIRDGLVQLLDLLRRRPGARTRKRRIDQSLERSRELGHVGRFVLMRHDGDSEADDVVLWTMEDSAGARVGAEWTDPTFRGSGISGADLDSEDESGVYKRSKR